MNLNDISLKLYVEPFKCLFSMVLSDIQMFFVISGNCIGHLQLQGPLGDKWWALGTQGFSLLAETQGCLECKHHVSWVVNTQSQLPLTSFRKDGGWWAVSTPFPNLRVVKEVNSCSFTSHYGSEHVMNLEDWKPFMRMELNCLEKSLWS